MQNLTVNCINELVFMERKNLFDVPDVILYHPGHFPELNKQLFDFYSKSGAKKIMIPENFNSFLNCGEFDFYEPLLIKAGIEKEKLSPIKDNQEKAGVEGVIQSAFEYLNNTDYKDILLAGKSFFCRRFYLLATIYANSDKVLDVLPLQDERNITPDEWMNSEKGKYRVQNEIEQYGKILKVICDI
ncbi:hypothetical protein [Bacillus sp. S/N-304-OC-R1]|uniref:hypothetical protein n=1 Tax=Bacillus sp. S/N-304-OC-R1 TaxID=2758034 RepID=UPI001C8D3BE9|nr:hypothetical protein [Bacillus sp. S/N-304-OC-R1]MBY0122004.1 hypothetical protein [Bacillus sp. S/N-304-OC-R1]